jgi:hypothetical protein
MCSQRGVDLFKNANEQTEMKKAKIIQIEGKRVFIIASGSTNTLDA